MTIEEAKQRHFQYVLASLQGLLAQGRKINESLDVASHHIADQMLAADLDCEKELESKIKYHLKK